MKYTAIFEYMIYETKKEAMYDEIKRNGIRKKPLKKKNKKKRNLKELLWVCIKKIPCLINHE